MPLVPMITLLEHAAENNYGVAAFNVNNMEQIQAIMAAAAKLHPKIPIAMHPDHSNLPQTCLEVVFPKGRGGRP